MDLSSRVGLRPLRKTPCTQERNLGGMDLSSQVGLRPFFSPPIAVGVGGGRRNGPEQSGGIATLHPDFPLLSSMGGMDLSSQVGLRPRSPFVACRLPDWRNGPEQSGGIAT